MFSKCESQKFFNKELKKQKTVYFYNKLRDKKLYIQLIYKKNSNNRKKNINVMIQAIIKNLNKEFRE